MDGGDWVERFEGLAQLPDDVRRTLVRRARVVSVPAGTELFGPGHVPDSLLLLIDGVVRVSRTSESGREIVLYRIEPGESCVLTTACLLADEPYAAEGIAETDLVAVAIPRATFDELLGASAAFRSFVLGAYGRRIADLFRVIDDVAFGRIDVRLADRLVTLANGAPVLPVTHQRLATELGTAREVISRQLTEFQRRGWIRQSRGQIAMLDLPALERLAAHA